MKTTKKFAVEAIVPLETSKVAARPIRRRATLRVKTLVETQCWAARLARDYTRLDLATVLTGLVEDLATAAERPGSWESEKVTAWLASHPWPRPPKEDPLWR